MGCCGALLNHSNIVTELFVQIRTDDFVNQRIGGLDTIWVPVSLENCHSLGAFTSDNHQGLGQLNGVSTVSGRFDLELFVVRGLILF